jgi:adenine-specific DNA methylase
VYELRLHNPWLLPFRLASNWTPAAERFVKKLLEEATNFWLVYKNNIKKKIYGELFMEVGKEILSLTNELCTKEYAVFSEELFEEGLDFDV